MSDQHRRTHARGPYAIRDLVELFAWCKAMLMAGHELTVEAKKATRSSAQNALFWSCMTDISRQVEWMVDGRMVKLDPEEWKEILSAGLKKTQRVAAGVEGGFVMLGQRTSRMTVAQMAELIELAHAFGAQRGVRWSRTSLGRDVPDELFAEAA